MTVLPIDTITSLSSCVEGINTLFSAYKPKGIRVIDFDQVKLVTSVLRERIQEESMTEEEKEQVLIKINKFYSDVLILFSVARQELEMSELNTQLVLISGMSATGKSASLRNLRNQEKWFYLGTEAGKQLPFKNSFKDLKIEDPYQVFEAFDYATEHPDECDGVIIDSLTFLMDMFESQYVLGSSNTMRSWSDYGQFFKKLMQDKVLKFGKPTLILAHTQDFMDDHTLETKTYVPVKGSLKANGVESFFTTVVSTKKIALKDLEPYKNDMLTITEEDELLGYTYCFQTKLTKQTLGERIRSPMGMFSKEETFINNDAQVLLDHLKDYYNN